MDIQSSKELLAGIENKIEHVAFKEKDEEHQDFVVLDTQWGNDFATTATYLSGINLSQYIELFHKEKVTNDIFFTLTDEDLRDIGVNNEEHRQKLLNSIANRGRRKKFGQCAPLSTEDVMLVLGNSCKHLHTIEAALTSTRVRLAKNENKNTLLTTYLSSARALTLLCTEADEQAKLLNNQFNAILIQKPGMPKEGKGKYISMFVCSALATCTAVFYYLRR